MLAALHLTSQVISEILLALITHHRKPQSAQRCWRASSHEADEDALVHGLGLQTDLPVLVLAENDLRQRRNWFDPVSLKLLMNGFPFPKFKQSVQLYEITETDRISRKTYSEM